MTLINPRSLIEPTGRFRSLIPKPVPPANNIRPFRVPFSLDLALLPRTKVILVIAAFMVGLKIGQLIRDPVRDFFKKLLDTSQPTDPNAVPKWQTEDALPEQLALSQTGQMGTEGAVLTAVMYWDKSIPEGDSCGEIATFGPNPFPGVTVSSTGGALRWSRGPATKNNCGWKSWRVEVLTAMPSPDSGEEPNYERVASQSVRYDDAGIPSVDVSIDWEPLGEPLSERPRAFWDPVPAPKPIPKVKPETLPQRVVPVPAPTPRKEPKVVPNVEPLPNPSPAPLPQTFPSPVQPEVVPGVQPAPKPEETQETTPQGQVQPKPKPDVKPTSKDAHVIGSPATVVSGQTMRSSVAAVAKEVGRIEQKMGKMTSGFPGIGGLAELLFLLTSINDLLNSQKEGTTYELKSVCECPPDDENCEEETTTVETAGGYYVDAILSRLDALPTLLQAQKDYKQPICNPKPTLLGDFRTLTFISDNKSEFGRDRLRKLFRYRSQSSNDLGQLVDHWKAFSWEAGPVCIQHKGAWWGTPQVWASTADEGKRVIRHAGSEAGINPDDLGEWIVSGSSSPRIGQSGTMRICTKGGYYWITERLGSNGKPLVVPT